MEELTEKQKETLEFTKITDGIEVIDTAPEGSSLARMQELDRQRQAGELPDAEFHAAVTRLHRPS